VQASGGVRHGLNVGGSVDQGEFALCREAGRDERKAAEFPVDEVVDHAQPVRAFRMAVAGVVLQVAVVFDEREGGHSVTFGGRT